MAAELERHPHYQHTIERLEAVKKVTSTGKDFWMARDIHSLLGYPVWDKFGPVIDRAVASLRANGLDSSHHIAHASKLMGVGRGGNRQVDDYFLSRPACRLIAMNGDPRKPEIAAAQAYFVVQAHRMEQQDALAEDEKRLKLRDRVKSAFRVVSGVAKDAGLPGSKQGLFHDARYQGLYNMPRREVMARKGLGQGDNPFDHQGPLELSANEFQMNMASDVIQKEGIRGEYNIIAKNKKIAQEVRNTMKANGATMPENLPVAEPIKQVEKRFKERQKLLGSKT